MVTTSIKKLRKAGYVDRTSITNEELLEAAARCAVETEGITDMDTLYSVLWDECDMSLAITLNEMDLSEFV
jgi:hypothetical protein